MFFEGAKPSTFPVGEGTSPRREIVEGGFAPQLQCGETTSFNQFFDKEKAKEALRASFKLRSGNGLRGDVQGVPAPEYGNHLSPDGTKSSLILSPGREKMPPLSGGEWEVSFISQSTFIPFFGLYRQAGRQPSAPFPTSSLAAFYRARFIASRSVCFSMSVLRFYDLLSGVWGDSKGSAAYADTSLTPP
ncbi:hypothetical protein RRG08_015257 [Elysia crispata]|uniref:Uncharacterized protein n=1 Tax=Elysia crispata TaxID=231223 RepID=A0AAE0YZY5_9GAST|nr:hypothetical protein RRG08_015257 [Elysia crispata]